MNFSRHDTTLSQHSNASNTRIEYWRNPFLSQKACIRRDFFNIKSTEADSNLRLDWNYLINKNDFHYRHVQVREQSKKKKKMREGSSGMLIGCGGKKQERKRSNVTLNCWPWGTWILAPLTRTRLCKKLRSAARIWLNLSFEFLGTFNIQIFNVQCQCSNPDFLIESEYLTGQAVYYR